MLKYETTPTPVREDQSAPEFFEKAFPEKSTYWTCVGTGLPRPKKKRSFWNKLFGTGKEEELWTLGYYSAEDAETHAYIITKMGKYWTWNRKPAIPISLSMMMSRARQEGTAGVTIIAFVNGVPTDVNRFPADKPISENLRD